MLKQFLPVLILSMFFYTADAQSKTAAYYYKSGVQLKDSNKIPEAIAAFNKAVSLNRNFDSAYFELGNLYLKPGTVNNSILLYGNTLAVNPEFVGALAALGKVYKDFKQNLDSAHYFYNAAAKLDSTNKEIFYSLAWVHNALKEYDLAIPYAVKALEIDNNYRPAYGELGHAYNASKQYKEAIKQFQKNLAVSVVDLAYLYSGYCYTEINDKEGALKQYEGLKKVNEKMAQALKKKIDSMQ